MKGSVFDIRRFSTHDGDGIRTTVFLKGCPLCCVWCQNPEGIAFEPGPVHFPGKCIHCKTCLRLAENGGICEENGEIRLKKDREENWEALADACPTGAIAMDSRLWDPEELAAEVLKDQVFFRKGGGVTLSGGEPLAQPEFTLEVLKILHGEGIHTAIETALHVSGQVLERALPFLDLIYADFKIAGEQRHRACTGVSNSRIKENLVWLLTSEHREKAVVRTPLIPGYTAVRENLEQIASFLVGIFPDVKYELLNYNPLAEAKYHLVDREYCFKDNPKLYTKDEMEAFGEIVRTKGIQNLIMEI